MVPAISLHPTRRAPWLAEVIRIIEDLDLLHIAIAGRGVRPGSAIDAVSAQRVRFRLQWRRIASRGLADPHEVVLRDNLDLSVPIQRLILPLFVIASSSQTPWTRQPAVCANEAAPATTRQHPGSAIATKRCRQSWSTP